MIMMMILQMNGTVHIVAWLWILGPYRSCNTWRPVSHLKIRKV